MEEALELLDRYTALTTSRHTFSAEEILDLLLDVRQALTRPAPVVEDDVVDEVEVPVPEPV